VTITFRTRLRNELRLIVKKIVVYPRGRVYSAADIERVEQKYAEESHGLSPQNLTTCLSMRDDEIEDMKSTQNNTKDNRFFEIYFKNGNYRNIVYSSRTKVYQITMDRMGDTLDSWMNGKKMIPLVRDNLATRIKTDIENYRKIHTDTVKSNEEIESMIRFLSGEGESFPDTI